MWSPTIPPFERCFQELSLLPSPIHLAEFSGELWSEVDVQDMTFEQKLWITCQVKMAKPEPV